MHCDLSLSVMYIRPEKLFLIITSRFIFRCTSLHFRLRLNLYSSNRSRRNIFKIEPFVLDVFIENYFSIGRRQSEKISKRHIKSLLSFPICLVDALSFLPPQYFVIISKSDYSSWIQFAALFLNLLLIHI